MTGIETLLGSDLFREGIIGRDIALVMPFYGYEALEQDHGKKAIGSITPPLGLLSLASHLRREGLAGDIRIFDSSTYGSQAALISALESFLSPGDILGFSTYTRTYPLVKDIASRFDGVLKIAGGALATAVPTALLTDFDLVFEGEAEYALGNVIRDFTGIFDGRPVKGLTYGWNGSPVRGGRLFVDLERLPLPAYDLIDWDLYRPSAWRDLGQRSVPYLTSYSCPGGPKGPCTFCGTGILHGKYRQKSTMKVLSELRELTAEPCVIEFWDDNFCNRDDLETIMQFLSSRDIKSTMFSRVDAFVSEEGVVDDNKMALLAEHGCRRIFFGIESANDHIRNDIYRKGTSLKQIELAIELADKYGIKTKGGYIFGVEGETEETIDESIRHMLSIPLSYVDISILSLDPGTVVYRERYGKNLVMPDYSAPEAKYEPLGMQTVSKNFTKTQLSAMVTDAYQRFYGRQEWYSRMMDACETSRESQLIHQLHDGTCL